ncbi:MAG: menaquinone biosynthesis protein [Bacteroidia bacterium]|nr:menaquinone biosynthesis protein [Bacteroidia bacterium]
MLSISLVSYLNTKPFLVGLNEVVGPENLTLNLLPPAECATSLKSGACDLALIPVGSLVDFQDLEILKDYCIGANGPVNSVFLFSDVPLEMVKKVKLDPHSRTSNALCRIILKKKGLQVEYSQTAQRDFDRIKGQTAGVSIGDTAFKIQSGYAYVYDLAEEWKRMTGLPFVFAVWASRPGRLDAAHKVLLNRAFEVGMEKRDQCAEFYGPQYGYSVEEAKQYLNHSIDFRFDTLKHEALRLYFKELLKLSPLPKETISK